MQMNEQFENDNYQVICNKENMILKLNKEENIYMLDFETINKNLDLNKLMDFKIYDLIQKLNEDLIEKIEIINNISDDEIELLFIFKRFGKSAGIPQKYLVLKTKKYMTNNLILFKSEDSKIKIKQMENHIAQKMDCKFAQLTIIPFQNKLRLNYKFSIDMKEDLPIYLENMMGLMMKKIFYRLKVFIEQNK
jgi:hypothetical protein